MAYVEPPVKRIRVEEGSVVIGEQNNPRAKQRMAAEEDTEAKKARNCVRVSFPTDIVRPFPPDILKLLLHKACSDVQLCSHWPNMRHYAIY